MSSTVKRHTPGRPTPAYLLPTRPTAVPFEGLPMNRPTRLTRRLLPVLAGLLLTSFALPARAAVPADPKARAAIAGAPADLIVQPASVTLTGPRARAQLVV